MDKSRLYSAIAIMAGLVFIGLMIPTAVSRYRSYDRTVSVRGLCEREVKADKVIWPLVIKIGGNDLNALYSDMSAQNAILKKFLVSGGIAENEISVSMSTSDKNTLEYNNDRAYRFLLKSVVTVATQNVDAVLALMDRKNELITSGVAFADDWENKTEFSFEALNDLKPEMIEEATRNAREVGLKFAQDSNSALGKIKEASQGVFSITDRDSNTPSIKKVRVVTSVTYYLKR